MAGEVVVAVGVDGCGCAKDDGRRSNCDAPPPPHTHTYAPRVCSGSRAATQSAAWASAAPDTAVPAPLSSSQGPEAAAAPAAAAAPSPLPQARLCVFLFDALVVDGVPLLRVRPRACVVSAAPASAGGVATAGSARPTSRPPVMAPALPPSVVAGAHLARPLCVACGRRLRRCAAALPYLHFFAGAHLARRLCVALRRRAAAPC